MFGTGSEISEFHPALQIISVSDENAELFACCLALRTAIVQLYHSGL